MDEVGNVQPLAVIFLVIGLVGILVVTAIERSFYIDDQGEN